MEPDVAKPEDEEEKASSPPLMEPETGMELPPDVVAERERNWSPDSSTDR